MSPSLEPEGPSLAELLEAHAARGAELPNAVAHAVLADLLSASEDGARAAEGGLSPDAIVLDRRGRAICVGPSSARALAGLAARLLVPGLSPDARPLLSVLADIETGALPAETERVALALREHLPPPAEPDELSRLAGALGPRAGPVTTGTSVTSELPTLLPEEAPPAEPSAVKSAEPSTLQSAEKSAEPSAVESAVRRDAPPLSAVEGPPSVVSETPRAGPRPAPLDPPEELLPSPEPGVADPPAVPPAAERRADGRAAAEKKVAEAAGVLLGEVAREGTVRPVVRHEIPRSDPPVAVKTAPAARRSARPEGADSILGPGDDRSWLMWLIVLAALAGAMYLLFFS